MVCFCATPHVDTNGKDGDATFLLGALRSHLLAFESQTRSCGGILSVVVADTGMPSRMRYSLERR